MNIFSFSLNPKMWNRGRRWFGLGLSLALAFIVIEIFLRSREIANDYAD